jgi:hypothetical protein
MEDAMGIARLLLSSSLAIPMASSDLGGAGRPSNHQSRITDYHHPHSPFWLLNSGSCILLCR